MLKLLQTRSWTAVALAIASATLVVPPAFAQEVSKAHESCINGLNKAASKLAAAQGKVSVACLRDAAREKLVAASAQDCLVADEGGKVAKLKTKVSGIDEKKCLDDEPAFGYAGASTVNAAAPDEQVAMVTTVFGDPLDDAIILSAVDGGGAKCQAAVARAYEKFVATRFKEFVACKKRGLKDGTITGASSLEVCVIADPKGKVQRARDKILATIAKRCDSTGLAAAFPGECQVEAGDAAELSECIARRSDCHACHVLNEIDSIFHNCDLSDNGVIEGSCRTCGNGFVEAPEQCDEMGETASCDIDCSLPQCGDGLLNVAAGEVCDDGNAVNGDGCDDNCTLSACGNGILAGNEECDDSNNMDGDGCSATCQCEPGSTVTGCQHTQCPDEVDLLVLAGVGSTCATNGDCLAGVCDPGIARCRTATTDDIGYTGLVHDVDQNQGYVTRLDLRCSGPGPVCGECLIEGIDPAPGNCRCEDDSRQICDEPFGADADDCGGGLCKCYDGPPQPAVQASTPVCLVWPYAADVSGTMNVDTGAGVIDKDLRTIVYFGELLTVPCPVCAGTCSAPAATAGQPCLFDHECDDMGGDGVCGGFDTVAGDGVREGTCVYGPSDGLPCDVQATSQTFPAPGGGGHSLDCLPDEARNISGSGVPIVGPHTTGTVSLDSQVECGFNFSPELCPCGVCSDDDSVACTSNADCGGLGTCGRKTNGVPRANLCAAGDVCIDTGDGDGRCSTGPDELYCDGLLRASGEPIVGCQTNADCDATDCGPAGCGECTLLDRRRCFPDPVWSTGVADPWAPVRAATYCIPPVNPGVDAIDGLPGPGRTIRQELATYYCFGGGGVPYTPGVGGCL